MSRQLKLYALRSRQIFCLVSAQVMAKYEPSGRDYALAVPRMEAYSEIDPDFRLEYEQLVAGSAQEPESTS